MLTPISNTDLMRDWLVKINQIINAVNNINQTNVFSLHTPINDGDIITYNPTISKFTNVDAETLVNSIINADYFATKDFPFETFISSQQVLF